MITGAFVSDVVSNVNSSENSPILPHLSTPATIYVYLVSGGRPVR